MTGQVVRILVHRIWTGALVLLGAVTLTFFALRLAPGNPVDTLLGAQTSASPRVRAQIAADLGLDQPVWRQYLHTVLRPLTGDLGRSYQLQEDVKSLLLSQLRPTAELALCALVPAVLVAVLAATSTAGRGRFVRAAVSGAELLAVSLPPFWLGLLLITAFAFRLHIFPVAGDHGAASLVLPALSLAVPMAGELGQVLRGNLDRTLEQPFVATLRARGLSEPGLRVRHALRHGSLATVTMTSWMLGTLFSGTVLVETLFARPGIGRITVNAVTTKDFPVVSAVVLLAAVLFVVINLVVDLLYLVLDPRLRAPRARPVRTPALAPASVAVSGAVVADAEPVGKGTP
ncbi:Dipeptide transport system permease protein DppB [Nocardia cerradoensis]|uniref:Dipeptide transport system permease protein DppB n=1 Tax=Nocardia cerradoensis TaxID=85688 RepID=A0A231HF97_9NOCA|nr:ABC transporter permease [Nocardia cerradoensis]OXR47552.1 Dipeptide transport system permease protein DppB [Nocardia cerradoensis]